MGGHLAGLGGHDSGVDGCGSGGGAQDRWAVHNGHVCVSVGGGEGGGGDGNGGWMPGSGAQGGGMDGQLSGPAVATMQPAVKTWKTTVDVVWDRASLGLFFLAFVLDIVVIAVCVCMCVCVYA